MLQSRFYQMPMGAVDPDLLRLPPDSFERLLREELPNIVSLGDFADWYSESEGAPTCCPIGLTGMLLLQIRYKLSDEHVVERARRDLGFRFALRLEDKEEPPSVSSLRRFRARLREAKGDDFLHRRVLGLAVARELIPDVELQAQDSSNTDCRGAVIDTFNLVAVGIGRVIRVVARALGIQAEVLAGQWDLSRYLARSIKGQAGIDWSDEEERNKLLTEEIRDADRLPQLIADLHVTLPSDVDEALALLAQVARQDVEELEDGTFKVKHGTAKGRVVSITDPEARHGRKSSSKTITGFKHHVQGTIESQFVTGIVVTDASKHDAEPSTDLIDQSQAVGLKPKETVADAAYGTGANIRACAEKGVGMLTKLPSASKKDCFTKREFDIDLENMKVTCPQGHTTTEFTLVKADKDSLDKVPSFKFSKEFCRECPLAQQCNSQTRTGQRRSVKLSPYEAELQRTKAFNASPRAKEILRSRSAIERLISHLVRMGMRHARFFGMRLTQYQAYLTAAAYNLQRIFTLTATPT